MNSSDLSLIMEQLVSIDVNLYNIDNGIKENNAKLDELIDILKNKNEESY